MFTRKKPTPAGTDAVANHQHKYFAGHVSVERRWPGPIDQRAPGMRVHEFAPGPRTPAWTYASVGVWSATHTAEGHGLEFVMLAPGQYDRMVELVTLAAFFHAGPESQRLDLGHTVPIGEPWLPGSSCDHLLVSLPYTFGPELEWTEWEGGHARHLWLLPITEAERQFKVEFGQEALEQRLENAAVVPTDPQRASVA